MQDHEFELSPSKKYALYMLLALLLGLLIIFISPYHGWLKLIAVLFAISYCGHAIWRYALLLSPHSILSIQKRADGSWQLATLKHQYDASLYWNSTITRWICILKFKRPEHFRLPTAIILRDSLPPEKYRQLLKLLQMSPN